MGGTENTVAPIADDELVYRKIPASMEGWFDASVDAQPSPEAFRPHPQHDTSGISFDRAKSDAHPEFRSIDEAGSGRSAQGYYVAVLRAGDLRAHGLTLTARPEEGNPGHAELVDLKAQNRKRERAAEIKQLLATKLTLRVEGPFNVSATGQ